ncbi:hypothetical protein IWX91DRAFT_344663 [Phyllosticta citricarpa]
MIRALIFMTYLVSLAVLHKAAATTNTANASPSSWLSTCSKMDQTRAHSSSVAQATSRLLVTSLRGRGVFEGKNDGGGLRCC